MEDGDKYRSKSLRNQLNVLGAFSASSLRHDLLEATKRLEHRAEVLSSLSHQHHSTGSHELAESCKRQAAEFQKQAQSIRKILGLREKRE